MPSTTKSGSLLHLLTLNYKLVRATLTFGLRAGAEGRTDISHVTTIVTKLRDLNKKVQDIQREQRYMREVEATFRDASEATNARAVWWSVIQIAVLIGAAVWQMRHLKVRLSHSPCTQVGAHPRCTLKTKSSDESARRQCTMHAVSTLYAQTCISHTVDCTKIKLQTCLQSSRAPPPMRGPQYHPHAAQ